jgi:hypothetical protein
MTDRMFRMLERLQKLDTLLARARPMADPLEIAWLTKRKDRLKARLAALLPSQQWRAQAPGR